MWELARLFLRMGFTAFGGPAAHIAMLHDEVVTRRKWVDEQHFLDMLGATNLIPGPNSTEMVLHVGYLRRGLAGLLVAGLCFIGPAMLIVLALASLYVRYGDLPEAEWLLYGVKPVVISIVLVALVGLGRRALSRPSLWALAVLVLALYLTGFNEVALLLGAGLLWALSRGLRLPSGASAWLPLVGMFSLAQPISLATLFFTFLKIGSVLYGSGYVLLAFLQADFVDRLGWLTQAQLIDAVAVGQFTPGPLFTTATFIGYVVDGLPGALLATLGIFLPSFVFVVLIRRLVERVRHSAPAAAFLDGVNTAAVALMAAVTLELGRAAVVDLYTLALAGLAALLVFRSRLNSAWIVLGGAAAGLLAAALGLT